MEEDTGVELQAAEGVIAITKTLSNTNIPLQQTGFNLDDLETAEPADRRPSIFSGFRSAESKDDGGGIKVTRRPTDTRILSPYFSLSLGTGNSDAVEENKELLLSDQIINDGNYAGLFPGWGTTRIIALKYDKDGSLKTVGDTEFSDPQELKNHNQMAIDQKHAQQHAESEEKITLVSSVAIAGCDLLSSCLYTAGTCASYAGKLAPIGLIMVTIMLMFFRHVYSEVVSCIPINGGTYNSILNTTSKKAAALAGCLSVLSYVATAIISAYESIVYLEILWPDVDVRLGTLIVLLFFLCLTTYGVKESSLLSCVMLGFHLSVMTILIIWSFVHGCVDGFDQFKENMHSPLKPVVDESGTILSNGKLKVLGAIFYGYSAALLGITGFESAANYVESLKSPRTFVNTVNWLWRLVGFYNPCLSIVCMMVLPMERIYESPGELLAVIAEDLGGKRFAQVICIDAVLILAGAVLTSYVGVSGLLVRLSRDKVIPAFVAIQTKDGNPVVANAIFFLISASLFVILFDPKNSQQISAFGGVYAIAFLCVLTAFATSAVMVKLNRGNMARLVIARWWEIWMSLCAVLAGLIGNITLTPKVFILFIIYLVAFAGTCAYMFLRVDFYSFAIWMLRKLIISKESSDSAKEAEQQVFEAAERQKRFVEYHKLLADEFRVRAELDGIAPPDSKDTNTAGDAGVIRVVRRASNNMIDALESVHQTIRRRSGSVESEQGGPGTSSRRRSASMDSVEQNHDSEKTTPVQLSLARQLIYGVKRKMSTGSIIEEPDERHHRKELLELDAVVSHNRIAGWLLVQCMKALDNILKEPFAYLCKVPDPIILRMAMEYINSNELTNNILLVHFVDDKDIMRAHKQFMHGVRKEIAAGKVKAEEEEAYSDAFLMQSMLISQPEGESVNTLEAFLDIDAAHIDLKRAIDKLPSSARELSSTAKVLDTHYNKKKVSCVVVRGSYFCPSAVKWVSNYLNISTHSMIMGTADETFPFAIGELGGIRIALPEPLRTSRDNASASVIKSSEGLKYMRF